MILSKISQAKFLNFIFVFEKSRFSKNWYSVTVYIVCICTSKKVSWIHTHCNEGNIVRNMNNSRSYLILEYSPVYYYVFQLIWWLHQCIMATTWYVSRMVRRELNMAFSPVLLLQFHPVESETRKSLQLLRRRMTSPGGTHVKIAPSFSRASALTNVVQVVMVCTALPNLVQVVMVCLTWT